MMLDLTDVKKGQNCEILWMFGPAAHTLREQFKLKESKILHMVSNLGKGYVIVTMDGKKLAMSSAVSSRLKVQTC